MPYRKKIRTYRWGLAAALAVALLNTWLAAHALGTLFAAEHWLFHTLDALTAVSASSEEWAKSNAAARGFLLEGTPIYMQRTLDARQQLAADIDHLAQVTRDNASQRARIALLRSRLNVNFAATDVAIHMREGYGSANLPQATIEQALNPSPDGQVTPRFLLDQIANEEKRLLDERQAESKAAHRQVLITFSLAAVFDIVLLIAAFELLRRVTLGRVDLEAASEHVKALNADLTVLNTELEARVEKRTRELEVSNQELEAFSYSVSHDLRAPLRTIDGFSLALEEDYADRLDDAGRDYISRVRAGVQRMGSLIDALLQLSRVTRGDLVRERVDLSKVVTGVIGELAAANPDRAVETIVQPGVLCEADPKLLRIAMENLVGNAWKYSSRKERARIEFGSQRRGAETEYFVRDNGAGFDMQYVDRLFTAFQRLHGDRDFKGSGIGLATVSRIIRRHHGEIRAEGVPDEGAAFYFTLGEDAGN